MKKHLQNANKQIARFLICLLEIQQSEMKWISDIQRRYNEIVEKLETQIDADEQRKESKHTIKDKSNNLSLEKIKMPKFDGEIRQYPQFKRDGQCQI